MLIGKESAPVPLRHLNVVASFAAHTPDAALFGVEVVVPGDARHDLSFARHSHALRERLVCFHIITALRR